MFKNLSKIFLIGIFICIAVYIGVFIGRVNSRDMISVPQAQEQTHQKIDLNEATAEDLLTIPGVTNSIARAIINYRTDYEKFDHLRELLYVEGIDEGLYQTLCRYLTIDQ